MHNNQTLQTTGVELNLTYEKIIEDIGRQHWSIIDHFLPQQLVTNLRANLQVKHKEDNLKKAAIGNRTNEYIVKNIRGDFIQWMDEKKAGPIENLFFKEVQLLIQYLNRTCFMGILHKEFHYALYPQGTFYKRHLDTFQNDDRRVLSMVFYLNEANWDITNGGDLVIYQPIKDGENPIHIHPLPGRLVIFESQVLEHEVLPVLAGERYSITGWLKTR
ncbi:2OG-Fe(II) oxygenase [Psychroflexus salis]|uniref:Oxidoreductase n=1 Tax=Psychroflexus salis TaxID=1526574 RepID=A0A917A1K0_9FLAO|nr:2OG-Fe(II) oxygenase [Psychroflexus salis]GGE22313.1 oxidoreductase [Psychroflexus salis]